MRETRKETADWTDVLWQHEFFSCWGLFFWPAENKNEKKFFSAAAFSIPPLRSPNPWKTIERVARTDKQNKNIIEISNSTEISKKYKSQRRRATVGDTIDIGIHLSWRAMTLCIVYRRTDGHRGCWIWLCETARLYISVHWPLPQYIKGPVYNRHGLYTCVCVLFVYTWNHSRDSSSFVMLYCRRFFPFLFTRRFPGHRISILVDYVIIFSLI